MCHPRELHQMAQQLRLQAQALALTIHQLISSSLCQEKAGLVAGPASEALSGGYATLGIVETIILLNEGEEGEEEYDRAHADPYEYSKRIAVEAAMEDAEQFNKLRPGSLDIEAGMAQLKEELNPISLSMAKARPQPSQQASNQLGDLFAVPQRRGGPGPTN